MSNKPKKQALNKTSCAIIGKYVAAKIERISGMFGIAWSQSHDHTICSTISLHGVTSNELVRDTKGCEKAKVGKHTIKWYFSLSLWISLFNYKEMDSCYHYHCSKNRTQKSWMTSDKLLLTDTGASTWRARLQLAYRTDGVFEDTTLTPSRYFSGEISFS